MDMTIVILQSDKYTSQMRLPINQVMGPQWIRYSYVTPLFRMKTTGWDLIGQEISMSLIHKLNKA